MTEPTKSEIHNALARKFVLEIAGETDGPSGLMVVIESTIMGTMMLLSRRDGLSPSASAEMVESAIARAMERFVAKNGRAR